MLEEPWFESGIVIGMPNTGLTVTVAAAVFVLGLLAALVASSRDPRALAGRAGFMDWKLPRKALSLVFCLFLITSGIGPFVHVSPTDTAEAHGTSTIDWQNSPMDGDYMDSAYDKQNKTVFGASNSKVVAIDAETGSYKYNISTGEVYGVSYEGNYLYLTYRASTIGIYDASNGQFVKNISIKQKYIRAIEVSDSGTIFFAGQSNITAMNQDGSVKWTSPTGDWGRELVYSKSDNRVYLASDAGIYAVNATDGSREWVYSPSTIQYKTLTVDSTGVYFGGRDGNPVYIGGVDKSGNQLFSDQIASAGEQPRGMRKFEEFLYYGLQSASEVHAYNVSSQGVAHAYTGLANTDQTGEAIERGGNVHYVNFGIDSVGSLDTGHVASYSSPVSGTVSDSSGNPIAQANLTITDTSDSSEVFSGQSNNTGEFSAQLEDGDYRLTANKNGYVEFSKTFTVSGSPKTVDITLTAKQTISGTVVHCSDGQAITRIQQGSDATCPTVSNATVEIWAVSHANITPEGVQSKFDRAKELLEQAKNPKPPNFRLNRTLTGQTGIFRNTSKLYPALYTQEDMGTAPWVSDSADLRTPRLQLPAGEPIIVTAWNPERGGVGCGVGAWVTSNEYNCQLPGKHVRNGKVVFQRVDHLGDEVGSPHEVALSKTKGGGLGDPSSLKYGRTRLSAGFYEVTVNKDGKEAVSYPVVVGSPNEVAETIQKDLRNDANQLTEQAKQTLQRLQSGKFERITVQADENGKFSYQVDDPMLKTVAVQAYKGGQVLEDAKNPSMERLRTVMENGGYNGSVYISTEVETVRVENAQGLTVETRELSAPPFYNSSLFNQSWTDFLKQLRNQSFSELPAFLQQQLNGTSRERLQQVYEQLNQLTKQNDRLRDRYEELLNRQNQDINVEINGSDASNEELRQRIQALQQTITELRDTIEVGDGSTNVGQNAVTAIRTFGADLTKDQVVVTGHWSNGTSFVVPDEYITLDQSTTTNIPGVNFGTTTVRVEDYPITESDPAGLSFSFRVAGENGIGSATNRLSNPHAEGEPPKISSIDLSTLRPGPQETVAVAVNPAEDSSFRRVTGATVYGPSGAELNTSNVSEGNRFTFKTKGAGVYSLRIGIETTDGTQHVETFRLSAAKKSEARPPSIRAKSGVVGVYALTGDTFQDGSIDVESNGQSVSIVGQLPCEVDAPSSVHVYTESVQPSSTATTEIRLVRCGDHRELKRHVEVTVHGKALSENALVYRNGEPLTMDGSTRYGQYSISANGTVYETYTDASGTLTLKVNNDPGYIDRLLFSLNKRVSFSMPDVLSFTTVPKLPDVSAN
ncbi:carboxypeptidase regulatory-like domain-containing protein (plasmid) [Halorussus vallis]|uniref:carboxypeptidase regulatory-like domain-containing protein n=1 Tax=Halorussus vallis TaxID=2953749 RepID=UPI00209D467A|nr:carboxypeptidase regulatory-like domain-containing protein [Halorussus vallis]USZ78661.1 carboxypeptidase regulatory-like domain-containing protein [Halorussus vallis]